MSALTLNDMHDYQIDMAVWSLKHRFCAVFADMGVGKTGATLTALQALLDNFLVAQVLIIAPARVAKDTWTKEIEKWTHTKHLSYMLLDGNEEQRIKKLETYTEINIISVDLVAWLVGYFGQAWPYDTVVIDESDGFKSPKSQRFRSLKAVRHKIDRMLQLTGTPTSNGIMDLWSQIYLLDQGQRLEKTITRFRNTYFTPGFQHYNWKPKIGAKEIVQEKISDICYRLDAKDHLTLPECQYITHRLTLPEAAHNHYKRFERDFLLRLEEDTIEAANAAVLTGKLRQCCQGALYLEGESKHWTVLHDTKISALKGLMDKYHGEPLLVATQFQSDVARIKDAIPEAVSIHDSDDVIDRWNQGDIKLLAAHPKSIGHGLNLQHGGRHVVWFGLEWSLSLYQQFNARLYRQGQAKPVMIHHLVMEQSVEEQIMMALSNKECTQRALLDSLRRSIEDKEGVNEITA